MDTKNAESGALFHRDPSIDLLRILCCWGVIAAHAAQWVLAGSPPIPLSKLVTGVVYFAATWWVLSVFIMISGKTVLGSPRDYGLMQFYTKRSKRVILPYLFGAAVYFLAALVWTRGAGLVFGRPLSEVPWSEWVRLFVKGTPCYHLFFFHVLLGLMVITPALKKFLSGATRGEVLTFVLGLQLITSIEWGADYFFGFTMGYLTIHAFMVFLPFYVLGYYISAADFGGPSRGWLLVLFFASIGGSTLVYLFQSKPQEYILVAPLTFITAVSVYTLATKHGLPDCLLLWNPALRTRIADATLGIYILHALVAEAFARMKDFGAVINLTGNFIHPVVGVPLVATVIFVVCLAIVIVLKKIPIVRSCL